MRLPSDLHTHKCVHTQRGTQAGTHAHSNTSIHTKIKICIQKNTSQFTRKLNLNSAMISLGAKRKREMAVFPSVLQETLSSSLMPCD